ncbi:hypothetical protein TNIN_479531 [Trichonephila inaurata madagascariensis]|uniref:Uncharacterized protein n=1 Tax=Trichonephila inaurata madagascariensis TaxID=2747483 RepID=A0A8X6Y9I1_9ARAC|nr:hypothetical protein TNIN_479531 [Trichonephila inaurata madagascariensis]
MSCCCDRRLIAQKEIGEDRGSMKYEVLHNGIVMGKGGRENNSRTPFTRISTAFARSAAQDTSAGVPLLLRPNENRLRFCYRHILEYLAVLAGGCGRDKWYMLSLNAPGRERVVGDSNIKTEMRVLNNGDASLRQSVHSFRDIFKENKFPFPAFRYLNEPLRNGLFTRRLADC